MHSGLLNTKSRYLLYTQALLARIYDAGVAVQREGRDLIVLKIMDDGGVAHGRAAGAARAAAHHRPDHQHGGQRQCKDERIDTRSFRLQKESTPVLVLFLTFRRRGA